MSTGFHEFMRGVLRRFENEKLPEMDPMDSKRGLVRTTANHGFESGRTVKRRAAQRKR